MELLTGLQRYVGLFLLPSNLAEPDLLVTGR